MAFDDRTLAVDLYVEEAGEGIPVVLLHGLTATHRYVVMGSKALERSGHRVDRLRRARPRRSDPAPAPDAYGYDDLVADLERVLDERGIERAVLAGASMGAHTLLRFALEHPERAAGAGRHHPRLRPRRPRRPGAPRALGRARRRAADGRRGGLRRGLRRSAACPRRGATRSLTVLRQRLAAHEHPEAVADALRAVPRSRPFDRSHDLAAIDGARPSSWPTATRPTPATR